MSKAMNFGDPITEQNPSGIRGRHVGTRQCWTAAASKFLRETLGAEVLSVETGIERRYMTYDRAGCMYETLSRVTRVVIRRPDGGFATIDYGYGGSPEQMCGASVHDAVGIKLQRDLDWCEQSIKVWPDDHPDLSDVKRRAARIRAKMARGQVYR